MKIDCPKFFNYYARARKEKSHSVGEWLWFFFE